MTDIFLHLNVLEMHYKQELQNAPTQADKNYGSYYYRCCCCSSHSIWAELRTDWAALEEVGPAWGALGGDQVRGSCSPPSLGEVGEAGPPPGAAPQSQPPQAPLAGAPARRVAGWVWVRPHRCPHTHRNNRGRYWDNLERRNIVTVQSGLQSSPGLTCVSLARAPAVRNSSGTFLRSQARSRTLSDVSVSASSGVSEGSGRGFIQSAGGGAVNIEPGNIRFQGFV